MLVVERELSHASLSEIPAPYDSVLHSKWFREDKEDTHGILPRIKSNESL